MSDSSEREWLTMAQAADRLGISPPTLRRWTDQGRINARRTLGGHRRIPASELPSIVPREVPPRPYPGDTRGKRQELPHGRAEVLDDMPGLRAENDRLRARLGEEQATVERLTHELAVMRRQAGEAMRAQAELRRVILRLVERDGGDAAGGAAEPARPGR